MANLREFLDDFFAKGPVPFCEFMDAALYHREFGYYTNHVRSVGRRGDFSTTASLSPVLGKAIAHWIEGEHSHFGGGDARLVEFGPGDGSLLREVLESLPGKVRRKLEVHLVEISPPLAEIQRHTLAKHRKRIRWHHGMETVCHHASAEPPGPVFCFSNEFVDAFPVRIFRGGASHQSRRSGAKTEAPRRNLEELHLSWKDGRLAESWLPARKPPESTLFSRKFPPGQRLEVHDSYRHWLHGWGTIPWHGSLLTIDYGDTAERIYHRRPHGTLRAYYQHQRLEGSDVCARFGKQDLTADVNFSDLILWGETLSSLETISLHTQREFLRPFARPRSDADAYLAAPHGPGHAFQVLHQRRLPSG